LTNIEDWWKLEKLKVYYLVDSFGFHCYDWARFSAMNIVNTRIRNKIRDFFFFFILFFSEDYLASCLHCEGNDWKFSTNMIIDD
jgi:hypothetical protein